MNLLMISLHADPTSPAGIGEGGGTHSYIRELLSYFANIDIKIMLITRKCHPSLSEYEEISENCTIQRIIVNGIKTINKKELYALHSISLQKVEIALEKRKFKPDLIHSIYWNSGQVARDLSCKRGIPYVHTVISNGLRRFKTGMNEPLKKRFEIEKQIFQSAAYIFCITPSERNDLVQLYQIDKRKIMIPGRPISNDFLYPSHDDFGVPYRFVVDNKNINNKSSLKIECTFNQSNSNGKWWIKKAFLYCGRLAPNKGIHIVLKAWYNLKVIYKELCPALWIVGGSLDEIELFKLNLDNKFLFEQYEECGDLIWWGYLDQRGISTLMLKSHALIMHSSYEPGGRVIIEALASGIPVISTCCGFGADYIYNWYNGFRVPFGDIDFLYHIMSLFIKQPYLSNNMGINAKKYMKKILREWNFYKSHQFIYTLAVTSTNVNLQNSGLVEITKHYKNYINVYPFFNEVISLKDLKIQLKAVLKESDLKIIPVYSDEAAIWKIKFLSKEYEVWQPYAKLMDKAYICSFIDTKVDKRSDQYEREKYVSASDVNPIFKYIDNYYIYIKKHYSILDGKQLEKESIQISVKNLLNGFGKNCVENIDTISIFFNKDWNNSSVNDIRNIYNEYYKKYPSYFFHSYNIDYGLSLRQLCLIFEDQSNMISKELQTLYSKCKVFLESINIRKNFRYGLCLENCSLENIIIIDEKQCTCKFKNASSLYIGDITRMTAHFLHSYLLFLIMSNIEIDSLNEYVDVFVMDQYKTACIGWLFIIVFENLVLHQNTFEYEKYHNELKILDKLKKTYISIEGTS